MIPMEQREMMVSQFKNSPEYLRNKTQHEADVCEALIRLLLQGKVIYVPGKGFAKA